MFCGVALYPKLETGGVVPPAGGVTGGVTGGVVPPAGGVTAGGVTTVVGGVTGVEGVVIVFAPLEAGGAITSSGGVKHQAV